MPSDPKMPPEAMTPAAEGFAAMHEVYVGLRGAGFSLWEAAAVIGAMMASGNQDGRG